MSLRSKIVLILVGVSLLWAGVDNGILRLQAPSLFRSFEIEEARQRLRQVTGAMDRLHRDLDGKARVYASLEGMEAFLASGGTAGFAADLSGDLLAHSGVDVFFICNPAGEVLWSRMVDPRTQQPMRLRELPSQALTATHPLLNYRGGDSVSGLMITERGPLFVSSYPVGRERTAERLAEQTLGLRPARRGSVILGRLLPPEFERELREEAGVALELHSRDDVLGDARLAALAASLIDPEGKGELTIEESEDGLLRIYDARVDLRTSQPLLLGVALERDFLAFGRRAVNYALLSALGGGCLILIVMLRLLQWIVIHPLTGLTKTVVEIGRKDDTSIRVGSSRTDEIGLLASEFDSMLEKLEDSRAQVVKTARKAGMSEIATGVLHNVGNVLNSVNVSATLVRSKAAELAVEDLRRMLEILPGEVGELARFVREDPRGEHLVPFLRETTQVLTEQRQELLGEVDSLGSGIDHIAELVRSQQSYVGTKGVFERADLAVEAENAVKMCEQALEEAHGIRIEREYAQLPPVRVDRNKLVEILVNLIRNACQSLVEAGTPEARVVVRTLRTATGQARIEVEDNGLGIPEETLRKIFQQGFTTKATGHGFGLHVSANAATEMSGRLAARSEGRGMGAIFSLDLPMEEAEVAQAA